MSLRAFRGSNMLEYSLVITILVAALLGIQIYLKRAVIGRWRQAADTFGYGRQYDTPQVKLWGD